MKVYHYNIFTYRLTTHIHIYSTGIDNTIVLYTYILILQYISHVFSCILIYNSEL